MRALNLPTPWATFVPIGPEGRSPETSFSCKLAALSSRSPRRWRRANRPGQVHTPGRLSHVLPRPPHHGSGAIELVPAVRPKPADLCGHPQGQAVRLPQGHAAGLPHARATNTHKPLSYGWPRLYQCRFTISS